MRIQNDGVGRTRRGEYAIDCRRRAFQLERAGIDSSLPEHRYEHVCIAANVRMVGGDVRQREKIRELAQDRRFVGKAVSLRSDAERRRITGRRGCF